MSSIDVNQCGADSLLLENTSDALKPRFSPEYQQIEDDLQVRFACLLNEAAQLGDWHPLLLLILAATRPSSSAPASVTTVSTVTTAKAAAESSTVTHACELHKWGADLKQNKL